LGGVAHGCDPADHLGLIDLDGLVIPPRPFRAWKVEGRG
jgi:hypothetical protein